MLRWVLAVAAAIGLASCRRPAETQRSLLQRLPTHDATVVSVDVATLRQAGVLKLFSARATGEEPEYQTFIRNSGFDYQRDLDFVLAAFSSDGTFCLARGRFDWKKLEAYAQANSGSCYDRLCRMPGSTPQRRISFVPIERDLMALAVSTDDLAAARLTKTGSQQTIEIPRAPVWISVPGASLRKPGFLPEGARAFAGVFTGADRVMLTLGAQGDAYEAGMEAVCSSPADARVLAAQLTKATKLFPAGDDLPGLLAAGSFSEKDRTVVGRWPIRKQLLDSLMGGG